MTETKTAPSAALMARARERWIAAGHDPAKFDAALSGKPAIGSDPTMRVVAGQVTRAT